MTASAFMSEPVYSAEASLDSLTAAPPSRTSQRDIWSSECSYLKQWCGHTLCTSCASGVCIHKRLLGAEPGAAPVLGGNPRNPRGTPGMHRPLPRAGSGAEKWSTLGRPLPRCMVPGVLIDGVPPLSLCHPTSTRTLRGTQPTRSHYFPSPYATMPAYSAVRGPRASLLSCRPLPPHRRCGPSRRSARVQICPPLSGGVHHSPRSIPRRAPLLPFPLRTGATPGL